ncbi:unnamed protein product [Polarella glacialis]|uniref:Uncharacterized protein n=1 Tax=Polarella glacialis TaxID=89957 RepID=A0A813KAN2_POLGL|nr:unnamed protein product [Polarella glacialis]CAE8699236.1 unnamed protein product [Polarella glacialis]
MCTALQYVPFMRDGGVFVALGTVSHRAGRDFPTFMEQQLAGGGAPYLRALYADPGKKLRLGLPHPSLGEDGWFASLDEETITQRLKEAVDLVRSGFKIPVRPEENMSPEGQVLVEFSNKYAKACKAMQFGRNEEYECAIFGWPEPVVYEIGPWSETGKCARKNTSLLRKLRRARNLSGYGAPEE